MESNEPRSRAISSCGFERIRIERVAKADGPGQLRSQLPGILRVEIEIQKVEWFVGRGRESFCRGGRDSVNKLRQRGVGDRGNAAFAEIVIVQAEDSGVGSEAEFVRAVAPGQIVVDEKARSAPALHPGIVEAADGGEGRIGSASLQHDRESRQRLLKIAGREQAFVPGKARIEIVHQVRRKNVRIAGCE